MAVEFGFGIPQGAGWDELKGFALAAERNGIDHVWAVDHMITIPMDEPLHEGWTVITMLAAITERLRFGHQVLCQSYRNPAFLAKMAATLDALSGGRLVFGLGAGWFSTEYEMYGYVFPSMGRRLKEFREALEICRRMWTQERATFAGTYYSIEDATCYPKPTQQPHPPIMIGGGGEKVMLRIVAEYADIWNNGARDIHNLAHKLDVLRGHCDAVGRSFDDITISQQTTLILGEDEADAKRKLAAAKEQDFLQDPEEVAIWGHPQRVIDEIGRHIEGGTRHFIFVNDAEDAADQDIERFASLVLPAFR